MKFKKADNKVAVNFVLTGAQIADLVLFWLEQKENKGVEYGDLTPAYIKNIVKSVLEKHGRELLKNLPDSIYLKRQDFLAATKGMIEV